MPQPNRSKGSKPTRSGKGQRAAPRLGPPAPGLFHDVVLAPDRELIPDGRPVISLHDDEEPAFQREVQRRLLNRIALRRRGIDHGHVAELDPGGLVGPRPRRRRRETIESERWYAGRPIYLPGAAESVAAGLDAGNMEHLRQELGRVDGLSSYLERRRPSLGERFQLAGNEAATEDPERDIARAVVTAPDEALELWIKTARLSNFPGDESLRVRISFGKEGDDDASRDERRHRLVSSLAELLLPGAQALAGLEEVRARLERHLGGAFYGTQHIAYWNAPEGGARFHHDAFADEEAEPDVNLEGERPRNSQRGVLYAQLTGSTLWLALSIDELVLRTQEFVRWMQEGDAPELRAALGASWDDVVRRAAGYRALTAELGAPDQGALGPLVNAPEFTGYLADAGHALALHPGDILLLPNHGLARTTMHSVFCASEHPGYALSVALRRRRS